MFIKMCYYVQCYNTGYFYSECHVIDHARDDTTCIVTSESYICKMFLIWAQDHTVVSLVYFAMVVIYECKVLKQC